MDPLTRSAEQGFASYRLLTEVSWPVRCRRPLPAYPRQSYVQGRRSSQARRGLLPSLMLGGDESGRGFSLIRARSCVCCAEFR